MTESLLDLSGFTTAAPSPAQVTDDAAHRSAGNQGRLHQVVIGKRLTYYDAIHYSNIHLQGRIVIIGK